MKLFTQCIVASLLIATPVLAQNQPVDDSRIEIRDIELSAPVTPFRFDGDVRDLPAPPVWRPGDPIKEIPRRYYPAPGAEPVPYYETMIDEMSVLQKETPVALGGSGFTSPTRNFAGQGFTGVNPPDTSGDVGPNHYIQMVNDGGGAVVRIYDKAEPTPNTLSTFQLDSLGSGQCASGFGDPIVLYDRLADRWMLSEFSNSGNNLCIYISQTGDPVSGGWFNYAYTAPSFPDYPKYGVWPTDANGGQGSIIVTANDGGPGIYAMNRGAMLAGSPGTYQRVTIPGLPGFGFEAPTPADLDGPTPPASGAPAIIMRHRDTENHSGPAAPGDLLEIWAFDVDWVTPANSVLTKDPDIDTSEFDSDLCGLSSFFCFPQQGSGTTLDPLREVIMNRLQYFNFGTHESLVGNLVTDVNGSDLGGIRWFELRGGVGGWTLFQEGTYSIDANSRWMGAGAMDQSGNIAVAYNVSSSSMFPSLRYTGRLADDPLNVMTQPETTIAAGSSPNSSNRYGDYAQMNLDPVDDCTFWFTGEYNTSTSWSTQIASFAFEACGCELAPGALVVSASENGPNQIDVSFNDADLDTVVEYRILRATSPTGPFSKIATVADTSPGFAGGSGYTYSDFAVSGGSTYYYDVRASDGAACTSEASNIDSATATGLCTLSPLFDGAQSAATPFSGICAMDVSWSAATPRCGGPVTYTVYRSTTEGFTPGPGNQIAVGVGGTTLSDLGSLNSGTRYYYVVRAVDEANAVVENNAVEVSGIPLGTLTNGTWTDDAGDTGAATMIASGPWSINAAEGDAGPAVYKTGNYGNVTCADLMTPSLQLGSASVLSFSSKYDIENSYDKGEVQISTDDGFSWQRLALSYPGNSTNASDNCGLPTGTYFTGQDLTFQPYTADLSTFSNQLVRIRFLVSSDGSVTGGGWWIDDLSITDVDVPGECTTGSGCEDNPFVSVGPDGPMTLCLGSQTTLTAGTTGGAGPFEYQWTRDGIDIPGADTSTLVVNETGTHFYNCKVRAMSCPDDVLDGTATQVGWRDTPEFGGLESVTRPESNTCGLDLAWSAGSTACDGPVTYSIYRDTTTPVALTPANRIRSGLTATSYTDFSGLQDGVFYFYVVRAEDQSTGQEDSNSIEFGAAPTSPTNGLQLLYFDDFEDAQTFSDWTITTGPGVHNCGTWGLSSSATQRPSAGSGAYALSNNSPCGFGQFTSNALASPPQDMNIVGLQTVTLGYDLYYNNGDDIGTVEVWDGAQWVVLWTDPGADANTHQEWDVTSYALGNSAFQVRFNYQNAAADEWFSVDDVFLIGDIQLPCDTVTSPPPAPDGTVASTPLTADRLNFGGQEIQLGWDVTSCPAVAYNLIYGSLANVSSVTLDGSACSLGTTGSFDWNAAPSADLFFMIVGSDGVDVESSWGLDSGLNERNGAAASGQCSVVVKDTANVCP